MAFLGMRQWILLEIQELSWGPEKQGGTWASWGDVCKIERASELAGGFGVEMGRLFDLEKGDREEGKEGRGEGIRK